MSKPILPLVSVVICTYNSARIIEPCIKSIVNQTYPNLEVIIVDAGSIDETVRICEGIYPKVKVVLDKDNYGYCFAENLGISESQGDFVLMINSDAWIDHRCIEEMVKTASTDSICAAVAPKIFLPLRGMRLDSAGTYFAKDFSGMNRGHMEFDSEKYDKECEVFGVSDAVALYRRSSLDLVGTYDPRFVAYQEEADLCLRLRMAGFKIVFNPRAVGYHLSSATVGEFSPRKIMLSERNVWWTGIKNCPTALLPYCAINLVLRYLAYARLFLGPSETRVTQAKATVGVREIVRIVGEALQSTVRNGSYLLRKRAQAQSGFKYGDDEIIEMIRRYGYDLRSWFANTAPRN